MTRAWPSLRGDFTWAPHDDSITPPLFTGCKSPPEGEGHDRRAKNAHCVEDNGIVIRIPRCVVRGADQ